MAGPSFIAPKSVKRSRVRRFFTLAEANRSLPLVRRIVADIVSMHARFKDLQEKARDVAGTKLQKLAEQDLDGAASRLNTLVEELAAVGCELKDPASGLVDFVGRHQGREVHLCWKHGEDSIGFWHDIGAGFAARQPVATLVEGE